MRINSDDKLAFFRGLYSTAKARRNVDFGRWYRQYKGEGEVDGVSGEFRTNVVRNVTYELIESQVNSYIPAPKVKAAKCGRRRERNTYRIETLCKNLRDELPFQKLNDLDERSTYIYGAGVFLIEWDNTIRHGDRQGGIRISSILPEQFVPQPDIYEVQDMEYCFVEYTATVDDIARKYCIDVDQMDSGLDRTGLVGEDIAVVVTCYYKNDKKQICVYAFSGSVQLMDLDNYYARKRKVCAECGADFGACNCKTQRYKMQEIEYEKPVCDRAMSDGYVLSARTPVIENGDIKTDPIIRLDSEKLLLNTEQLPEVQAWARERLSPETLSDSGWITELSAEQFADMCKRCFEGEQGARLADKLRSAGEVTGKRPVFKDTLIPYYVPTLFPIVVRKNTSVAGSVFGQSDVEFVSIQQQELNKIETRIQQKLLRAGVLPYSSYDTDIEFTDEIFESGIKIGSPAELHLLGKLDLQPLVEQDMRQAERLYEQAKRVLGITDSYQGMFDYSATSGKARQIAINQASGRLQSKKIMKNCAYAEIDHIIFQLMLAYSDEPRELRSEDEHADTVECFNRYDFLELDDNGEWYYDDCYIFATDSAGDIESDRQNLWSENRDNYRNGVYGEIGSNEALIRFWQNMEKEHYPFARDMLQSFAKEDK